MKLKSEVSARTHKILKKDYDGNLVYKEKPSLSEFATPKKRIIFDILKIELKDLDWMTTDLTILQEYFLH